jgi:hypothetical protein
MIRADTDFLRLCERLAAVQSVPLFSVSFSCGSIHEIRRVTSLGYKRFDSLEKNSEITTEFIDYLRG